MFFNDYYNSPIGNITMASDGESLCGLWFDGQKYFASTVKGETEDKTLPVFEQTKKWLDIYFSGNKPDFMPKLSLNGSEFRKAVWDILLTIPYGSVMTYGEIAKILAKQRGVAKMSAQAVGGAVGHNPISIIVPCHRVVGKNGNLTGYAGGIDKKISLLKIEKTDVKKLIQKFPKELTKIINYPTSGYCKSVIRQACFNFTAVFFGKIFQSFIRKAVVQNIVLCLFYFIFNRKAYAAKEKSGPCFCF